MNRPSKNRSASSVNSKRQLDALTLEIMQSSLTIQTHFQLLLWLQGDFQQLIPHDALISVRGDFNAGDLSYDIVSALPGLRTEKLAECSIHEFRKTIHQTWLESGKDVTATSYPDGCAVDNGGHESLRPLGAMRHAVFHAIPDMRARADHLYILLRGTPPFDEEERLLFGLLLPHLDAAQRKIEELPIIQPEQVQAPAVTSSLRLAGLSIREIEILHWVGNGKTNSEIGMILAISANTVKNHLQRIFRKIHVANRAQAVIALEKMSSAQSRATALALAG